MRHEDHAGRHRSRLSPPQSDPQGDGRRSRRWLIAAAVGLAILAAVTVPTVFAATEQPLFCTTCHEMTPYYTAFNAGAHKNVQCVDCHVDAGLTARLTHKFSALKEVADHFTTKPTFPQPNVDVPDARCRACHKDLPVTNGFDHAQHTKALACSKCHADVGHQVTQAALAAAGILNTKPNAFPDLSMRVASTATSATLAAASQNPKRLAGHKPIGCTKCHETTACQQCHFGPHNQRGPCVICHRANPNPRPWTFFHPDSTACQTCHTSRHVDRGACTLCHKPGTTWAFTHPTPAQRPDCVACHAKPAAASHARRTKCAGCHAPAIPFAKTAFSHNGRSCLDCHDAPAAGHHTGFACQTCHQPATSWALVHPASSGCASCHTPPANHYGTSCASCHQPGVPFKSAKVDHSIVGTSCENCHNPPASHGASRQSGCSGCHQNAGSSWAFSHPSSSACASCHTPPANHLGSNCASCHSPSVPFASTRFNHPSVGMNISNMSCTECHPNGYATHTCAKCHGSASGPGN